MALTAKQSLDMLRAINELTEGLKESAPLLYRTLSQMMLATSGVDHSGYLWAMDLIDKASVDEKDALLLLATQWMATVLYHQQMDPILGDMLKEIFSDSKILKLTPGCDITEL